MVTTERLQENEGVHLPLPYYCTATSRKGERCGKRAIPGGRVCRFHGGAAPQVKAAAAERLRELQGLAIDRLFEDLAPGSLVSPEVKLKVVDRLQHWLNLAEGKATSREDRSEAIDIRRRLELRIEQVSARLEDAPALIRHMTMADDAYIDPEDG